MIKVLVLTDFSSGYSRSLLRGIVRYSQQVEGWTFYRMPLYYRMVHGDKGVVEWAKQWKADAIIAQLGDVDIDLLRDLRIPIILQNYRQRIPGVCNLTGNYVGTGEMAAAFFLQKGFFNFSYYGTDGTVWSRERGEGFRKYLEEKGHTVTCRWEPAGREAWDYDLQALGNWLRKLPQPTALFCCDDQFALQVSETCKICGLSVPEQIAILGVDNDELLCNIASPPLSSIQLDVENGGYQAARILHSLVRGESGAPGNISVEALQVIERPSTRKYAITDRYILESIEYIERHFASPIPVSHLLERVPFSRRVFEKRFKQATGVTLGHFILQQRIDRLARELLASTRPVQEIAFGCGFEDGKNVARVFAKFKGMTPSAYRKKYSDGRGEIS